MSPLRRVIGLWRPEGLLLASGGLVSLLCVGCGAALALTAGRAIVPVALGGLVLLWSLRLSGAGRVVLRYAERMLTHRATFRALARLRVWFFRQMAGSALGGLGFLRSGDALARLVDDVQALDGLYIRIVIPAIAVVVLLPMLMWATSPAGPFPMLLLATLLLTVSVVLPLLAALSARGLGASLTQAGAGLRVAAIDAVTGLREVRAFGAEGRMLAAVQAREAALLRAQRQLARSGAAAQAASVVCGQLAVLLVLVAGLPPQRLLPAIMLTLAVFEAVTIMPRAGVLLGLANAAARRIVDAATAPPAAPDPATPAPLPSGHGLAFENVTFGYQGRPAILHGLSLDIPQGARVAILGPSGAGKSTLAALALRVVSPSAGRVLLGGVNIADLAAADVHASIAWLSQATTLFEDTIRANLLLSRPDADDDALWRALEDAAIADVVRGLPEQLDTWLGAGGVGLSGGQARRLALARTLLADAPILLLDEPATGLDPATERAFLTTLNEVAVGRTVILIVHRLTGVERLDRIWRLSGGKAVAAAG
ncbi:MAG: thiol reductant ABC exporter subunit CydC [Acetobacteraceae bacterium]|nr:thiol reductant ABC exporter subunit CydC [Acetobacteraceae bacterium]